MLSVLDDDKMPSSLKCHGFIKVIRNLKSKKIMHTFFYNSMDSFHCKTYVHILFSEENSLIYSYLEEVYFI